MARYPKNKKGRLTKKQSNSYRKELKVKNKL
jgi:hypothetical protein